MKSLRPRWLARRSAETRRKHVVLEIEREIEAKAATNPVEHELVHGDIDSYKEDVFVSSGDGVVHPTLPTVPARELDEQFQRDEDRPPDPTP